MNASLETLVNRAFRAVASDQDVASAFTESGTADAEADPWTIWRLTTRLNAIVDLGMSNTELRDRIKDVNQYRNDVSHGNPVELASDQVKKSVDALGELGSIVDRKVVEHLSPA